jgi:hypothetical protein
VLMLVSRPRTAIVVATGRHRARAAVVMPQQARHRGGRHRC